ncbi:MAG: DUF4956 domain-containing protein [Clostridiales bacterium]|nr:DUF4956 domain-containing protein [Clostridiales bacterium]
MTIQTLAVSFNDIFKSSFLEKTSSFSLLDMAIGLALAFILGLFIFFVYKKTYRGVMYSGSFGLSLLAMTMVTTLILLAVTSNVVLSLGMVGALSIVRFRTAVKEPMDIVFIFWAIAAGIVLGAGFIPLAVFGSVFIGLILFLFTNRKSHDAPYVLVVNCVDDQAERLAGGTIGQQVRRFAVKSKTVSPDGVEVTYDLRLREGATQFVNQLADLPGVRSAVLVSYNGEYLS